MLQKYKTNKIMKQTAVEWLYKNLLENPISNQDIKYNETVFHNAKEMEKEQERRSYSEEEVNSIFYAICKHSFFEDNVETVYLQDVKDEFEQFKNK